ncbi:hypothetical protein [uncultured Roseobacter sp.]|uniref:hypothetical protein n=1 Tax=uncultured Roseobacter sp. TaxID=114847 RepID=UPI002616EC88|nr:hypothetical protein [uncultured Roseobacter sp.]
MSDDEFFIVIKKVDGDIKGHAVRRGKIDKESIASTFSSEDNESSEVEGDHGKEPEVSEQDVNQSPFPQSFKEVERSFSQAMLMYRKSVVETIKFAPFFANLVLSFNIERIATSRGTKRQDLSTEEIEVYSLPSHAFGRLSRHKDRSEALIEGAQHLPKISTIGIISSYDAILSDLLRVIFEQKPEIVFTSDREVKFSELIELKSLDAIRENIISNEIEGVIRRSHHEQFSWMEKTFGMKLREGLDVWPDFIELCERRNLLTHTGGVVSEQYLKNCEHHGRKAERQVGDRLDVDIVYLTSAINIVSEVGYKLIHTLWRKFSPDQRRLADGVLNETGMNLIAAGEHELAEELLRFGVGQRQHSSDLLKRMMIVNLANAAKLGGHKERCEKALSSHDWSATSYQFQICVASVRNDFKEVKRLLKLGGDVIEITPSSFRDWPVFRDARNDAEVQVVFEEVFGEPLKRDIAQSSLTEAMADDDEAVEEVNKAIH